MSDLGAFLLAALVVVATTIGVSAYLYYGRLYMRSRVAGADIGLGRMLRMTASGISAFRVVSAYLNVRRAGFDVPLERFEELAKAGGDPRRVAQRLESARRAGEVVTVDAAFSESQRAG